VGLVLRVEDAEFYYDVAREKGFRGVGFSLNRGEVMCILGPNGCGKTTLLKCMIGLLRMSKGHVWLDGREIGQLGRREIAKVVGYVPQLHQPAFPFSVLDAVLVGRAPHLGFLESPGRRDEEIAEMAIDAMGITGLKDRPYTQLSGGEMQLVVFARVLAQQPRLLLLDEPTSHLDFGNQIRVLHTIGNLASTGLPVIMTSHFPDHAFLVSSKVAIMKDNLFLAVGSPDEVITEDSMERIYGIKVKILDVETPLKRKICVPLEGDAASSIEKTILLKKLMAQKVTGSMREEELHNDKANR
jgi:iron complex transport system ATP-binding protein